MGEKPIWGTPTIMIADQLLNPIAGFTPISVTTDALDDSDKFWVDNKGYSITFEAKLNKATVRGIRKLFYCRIPRKVKKALKKALSREYGIKVKKFSFNKHINTKKAYE